MSDRSVRKGDKDNKKSSKNGKDSKSKESGGLDPGLRKDYRVPKRLVAKLKVIEREVSSTKKILCYQNQI